MSRHLVRWLSAVAALLLANSPPAARAAGPFGSHPLWSDGKAEYSVYTGTMRTRAGDTVRVEAAVAVVREDFDRRLLVKSDAAANPRVNFPVLKQVVTVDMPVGVFRHHLESTSFLDAKSWRLVKLTAVSAEARGVTWVQVKPAAKLWVHRSSSYFDGEGDRELKLPAGPDAQALDALPLWLRGQDLSKAGDLRIQLLPGQAGAHVTRTSIVPALVHLAEAESLTVPAGTFLARRVEVRYQDAVDVFYFDTAFPFLMVRSESAQGMVLELKKSLRLDYWNKTRPGDERLLGD